MKILRCNLFLEYLEAYTYSGSRNFSPNTEEELALSTLMAGNEIGVF